ncbi:MAG: YeeE/YedE thiosulfate transporter family protein [Bacteroidales bacterium]|jgi:hypothetical protein|nr:YeeE/YedE thiosulfate transporter family protein [Bacteroidales bacterium]
MIGPIIPQGVIAPEWNHVIGLLLGMGFGFVLESSGFSSSRKLAGVFYGYDFVVLKVFFTAAITAAVGIMILTSLGWIDSSLIYVNPTFIHSAIIGGVIMGIGFIMGGYCPGTSLTGVAIGKIDAMVYTVGMFFGILFFSQIYTFIEPIYNAGAMGSIKVNEILGISGAMFMFLLIIVALAAFYIVGLIEKRVNKSDL